MEKYQFIKKLGEGAFGVVIKCVNQNTQEPVAVKKMKGKFANWDTCVNSPEVQSLKKLNNNPFVIKIKEMIHNKKDGEVSIVFEYAEKNLYQQMQESQRRNAQISEATIKSIMFQALHAVNYVHQNGYMHRDIKPENFLINKGDSSDPEAIQIKLGDFGLAKNSRINKGPHTDYVSTRWYRAPELCLRSTQYTQSVDVFALGCIMAELYLGRPLFPGQSESDQLNKIISVLGTPSNVEWPEGIQLASRRGVQLPRMIATPLKDHFGTSNRFDISPEAVDLITRMLRFSQDSRITAAQALQHEFFSDIPASLKSLASSGTGPVHRRRNMAQHTTPVTQDPVFSNENSVGFSSPVAPQPVVDSTPLLNDLTNKPASFNKPLEIGSGLSGLGSSKQIGQSGQNIMGSLSKGPSFQTGAVSQPAQENQHHSGSGVLSKPKLFQPGQREKKMNINFNARMSKYGQGSLRTSNIALGGETGDKPSPSVTGPGSILNMNKGDRNESSPYSNNFGQYNGGGNMATIPAKSKYSSKLETYENDKPAPKGDGNQVNTNDDFLDKMMNQQFSKPVDPAYGGRNIATHLAPDKPNLNSSEGGYGTFYQKQGINNPKIGKPPLDHGQYQGGVADQITQSQSVGLLPIPRSGSRLDQSDKNQLISGGGAVIGQASPYGSGSQQKINPLGQPVNKPGRGLGGIGGSIISQSGMNQNFREFGGAVGGTNSLLQQQKHQGSSTNIPVIKPQNISPPYNQFSNLGQNLINNSPDKFSKKAADDQPFTSYRGLEASDNKASPTTRGIPSSNGRGDGAAGKSGLFGGAAMGILQAQNSLGQK